jgi:peroxiredoxin Q/BCP
MLQKGTKAPDFSLPNENGETISLRQFIGKKVVLYFYPKDDTPGCSKEARSFRDAHETIVDKDAVVLGISADSQASHTSFKSKFNLPFHLLSDPDHAVIERYGAWRKPENGSKSPEGIVRSTVIIDENGHIAQVFPNVKPENHAKEVLQFL